MNHGDFTTFIEETFKHTGNVNLYQHKEINTIYLSVEYSNFGMDKYIVMVLKINDKIHNIIEIDDIQKKINNYYRMLKIKKLRYGI